MCRSMSPSCPRGLCDCGPGGGAVFGREKHAARSAAVLSNPARRRFKAEIDVLGLRKLARNGPRTKAGPLRDAGSMSQKQKRPGRAAGASSHPVKRCPFQGKRSPLHSFFRWRQIAFPGEKPAARFMMARAGAFPKRPGLFTDGRESDRSRTARAGAATC